MRAAVMLAVAIGIVAAIWSGTSGNATVKRPDDPYLWLEDIHGPKAMTWVHAHNVVAEHQLKTDPRYRQAYDALLAILDAGDRIPLGELHGNYVMNFWQDPANPRGLWRRATIASYTSGHPQWEPLLDVDRLAATENKNWVWKGATCTKDSSHCLISLSPGGGDAIVIREFDVATKSFLADGFQLAEAKSGADYIDKDTVMFGTDFGPGTMTTSGYPRIVKIWHRGQKVSEAKVAYEGRVDDVSTDGSVLTSAEGDIPLVIRSVDFFTSEYFYVGPDGLLKLPLPDSADVKGATHQQIVATLRKDWTPEGGPTIKAGSLVAFSLTDFLVGARRVPKISVLYTPDARGSINDVDTGRDVVYASVFENVTGSVHAFRFDTAAHTWTGSTLPLPANGSTDLVSTNDTGPEAMFTYEGFLSPTTLYFDAGEGKPNVIQQLPARFDAAPYAVAQYEAVSKDGTRVPYFVVRRKDAAGPAPTILYGYGGFEISQAPWYWASAGKVWLAQGGAYAIANIRGGGEFGPAWHEAALKLNRQRAYDDFIAVAEDLQKRGLTTPKQLGIMGGSNGGLLVGAVTVERPDLFGAVVCQVPLLDMIRYTKIGAGASWIAEYGDPAIPTERAAILKYSPYQNVRRGVNYPPIFFVTATSDDRVTPVHARKMAARMLEQGHDVLFFENTDGGHAASANHEQAAEMNALTYTYLAQKLELNH